MPDPTPDMQTLIRILHLEDSTRDADFIQDLLEAEASHYEISRAANRKQFEEALAQPVFHLILCDFNLPDFDGLSALKLAKQRYPETPVIIVSGAIDAGEAGECLKEGATDYLLKQRLERLPSAVQRALVEAQLQKEQQEVQARLRESEERFRQLAEHSSEGFWFVGLNPKRTLYVSPAVEKIWGLPAAQFYEDACAWLAAIHPDDQTQVRRSYDALVLGQASQFEAEYRVVQPGGSIRWVLDSGTPIHNGAGEIVRVSGVARDITERKRAERQALRTQRLESIGTLAGGVAHDLNNALAPIMMATEMLRMRYPDETKLIGIVEASARRGADMVRQLLTFAKGVEGARLLIQPRHLLKEMEKIIKGTFPKNIELRTTWPDKLQTVLGDSTQLHQVLLNLCVNARDAMPNGGTLTLAAENAEIDATYASAVPEAKPGRYVVWRVTDTGTGIPPEIVDRIFEPFFTTKGLDKGTGLGLSTVIGIVKSHGGFVQVYSTPGQGSTFAVYLPTEGLSKGDTSFLTKAGVTFQGNGETILVVDDEPAVREITRAVLTKLNFTVITASDGTEALIQVAEHRAELRVVITDLHMPNMDGLTFVRVLRHMLPEAGIIVASGRLDEREENEFKTLGVSALLAKPFTQETLVAAVKTALQKSERV